MISKISAVIGLLTLGLCIYSAFCLENNPVWWTCSRPDALDCYGEFLDALDKVYMRSGCSRDYCAKPIFPNYKKEVDAILMPSATKNLSRCVDSKPCGWTAEMEHAANKAISGASSCQLDYTLIFSIYRSVRVSIEYNLKIRQQRAKALLEEEVQRRTIHTLSSSMGVWRLSDQANSMDNSEVIMKYK